MISKWWDKGKEEEALREEIVVEDTHLKDRYFMGGGRKLSVRAEEHVKEESNKGLNGGGVAALLGQLSTHLHSVLPNLILLGVQWT